MRLFGKRAFSRRNLNRDKDNEYAHNDDSIGSDISTKDQFDIVIPIKSKTSARNCKEDALASRSWGAGLFLLDTNKPPSGGSGGARPHGEDDTTVSSITTSPEWQQPYGNGADGVPQGEGGSRRFYNNSNSKGGGGVDDDGRTSWACCCAPMTTSGADGDYNNDYTRGGEPPSMSLGGRSPDYTDRALVPDAKSRPFLGRTRVDEGGVGGGARACGPVVNPSILAHETRHDDDYDEAEEDAVVAPADNHAAAKSLATNAPTEANVGGCTSPLASSSSPPPTSSSPPAPSSSSDAAWCCAGAGLAGICWGSTSPHDADGSNQQAKDDAQQQAWNARRSHSLFDGLDDDDANGGHGTNGGHHRGGRIKTKIINLRKAIVPWGSHLRQRSKSFRKSSKSRNNVNQAAAAGMDDDDAAPPPMAILATTHREDHYYWKSGVAAE